MGRAIRVSDAEQVKDGSVEEHAARPRIVRVTGGWVAGGSDPGALGLANLLTDARAIAVYDVAGPVIVFNDAMQEILGWPVEEIERRGWIACIYPDPEEQAATLRNSVAIYERRLPVRHSRTFVRGDGRPGFLDLLSSPIDLPDGRRAIFTVAADATERKTPVATGRGYRELVEDAPDIITRVDVRSGRHLFASRATEPVTGYTPEEIYADPSLYRRRMLPEFRDTFDRAVRAVIAGEAQWVTVDYRRKDGSIVSLHQALYPVRDASGRVVAIEGVARDITQVRALERQLQKTVEELRARNQELSSLDRLKSQLLANVSHELRTPLVTIKGYNEMILRGALGPVTPRQRRALETASGSTERLVELIESLLDFARLEEGRLALRRAHLDVRGPVREAVDAWAGRIGEKGLTLRSDLGTQPLEVEADRARLAQVVKALLSNAEKFCEAPGEIRVRTGLQGGRVFIAVSDTGIGIPRAAQSKIFDRFYQVDSSMTRRYGGAGLGLALAREIAILHGGEVTVESEEGRGSTFTVFLPRAAVAEPPPAEQRAVLLIGAPPHLAPAMRARLDAEGLLALEAASGAEVVRRARRHRPDAVVLALEDDLLETIEALHADGETTHIPVIAMADNGRREAALPLADYVVGPDDWARLAGAVRRLLGRAGDADRSQRVLVVDDEPEIVDFTRFVLEREGIEVTTASSGLGALKEIERDPAAPFDLVILDLAMEGLDGIEVCRQLKSQPRTARTPILMLTAMTGDAVQRGAWSAGADGFLVKPFGVEEFLRQVRLHLQPEPAVPEAEAGGVTRRPEKP